MAERDACTAYLANNRAGAGNFCDAGGFAEAHLANALAKISIAGQAAHPTRRTRIELAQRRGRGGGLAIHRRGRV